jgi:hypothetical protein
MDEHKGRLMSSVGSSFTSTTYPPYNLSETPPPSFVFIDACDVFQADFSWTLYPKLNLYAGLGSPQLKNMFTAGWTTKMKAGDTEVIAETLIAGLMSGRPAKHALEWAVLQLESMGIENVAGTPIHSGMIAWHGDPNTKTAGVYTGDQTLNLGWYQ